MPEWRFDPITGDAVVIAEGRAARPVDYLPPPAPAAASSCPFCEGREGTTPPELSARRAAGSKPNGPGWTVRVIPNKFPTFVNASQGGPPLSPAGSELLRSGAAIGVHEVVIQSPAHEPGPAYLAPRQVREVVGVYRERLRSLEEGDALASLALVENWGGDSGGSLSHPHGQILGTPLVPPALERTVRLTEERARAWKVPCPVEHWLTSELADPRRVVVAGERFVALTPFASTLPYQLRVAPRRHARSLSEATDAELDELSVVLPRLERALLELFPGASYNVTALFPARNAPSTRTFHWTVDLLPRLVKDDGFELVARVAVNPVSPESAAAHYRTKLEGAPAARPPA